MYTAATLKTQLISLIGWRQNVDTSGWQLTDVNTSSSGLWFNEAHPMLNFDNLVSVAPRFQDMVSGQPAVNAAFTNWVKIHTEAGILQAIDDWKDKKVIKATAGNLLEHSEMFQVTGNLVDKVPAGTDLVGFAIDTSRSRSLATTIRRIGVQLDEDQTLTVKLFKSKQVDAVQSVDIVYDGSGATGSEQWETVDWQLEGGETYFVAYDQGAISGQAINGIKEYTVRDQGASYAPRAKFYTPTAFNAAAGSFSSLWDLTLNQYTRSTNYGLNLDVDVRCDYTQFIVDQKNLFKNAIHLGVAIHFLQMIAYNQNAKINNNMANLTRDNILTELEGTKDNKGHTIMDRYVRALEAIQFDQAKVDDICLKCKKTGATWKTAGPVPTYNSTAWPHH